MLFFPLPMDWQLCANWGWSLTSSLSHLPVLIIELEALDQALVKCLLNEWLRERDSGKDGGEAHFKNGWEYD